MYPKLVIYLCFMLMQQLRAFGYALNGIGLFFWKERHAKIHAVAALFIITLSFYLHITSSEWLWVLLCITLVIVSEMINTAIERLCNKLTIELDPEDAIILNNLGLAEQKLGYTARARERFKNSDDLLGIKTIDSREDLTENGTGFAPNVKNTTAAKPSIWLEFKKMLSVVGFKQFLKDLKRK